MYALNNVCYLHSYVLMFFCLFIVASCIREV